jgi:hypothetical protein
MDFDLKIQSSKEGLMIVYFHRISNISAAEFWDCNKDLMKNGDYKG